MNNNICKDIYGKELRIGDIVIPVVSKDLLKEKEGIITEINVKDGLSYISLIDEKGETIREDILSSYYTTKDRYNKYENDDIILWINFHSKDGYIDSKIPLNSSTNTDFDIPKNTIGISISFDKYEQYDDESFDSSSEELYFFANKRNVDIELDEDFGVYIVSIKENGKKDWISSDADVKIFTNQKNLKKSLINTINFLKTKDLEKCNRKIPYEENKDLQMIKIISDR